VFFILSLLLHFQECIKPVKIPSSVGKTKSIVIGKDGSYVATNSSGEKYVLPKAKIDLNDCLACSGCITTAETILVSQHSVEAFLNLLKNPDPGREIVVSLSPQSLASLAASLNVGKPSTLSESFVASGLSPDGLDGVRNFCVRLLRTHGVTHVLDTTWSRDLSLSASAEEFVQAFSGNSSAPHMPVLTGICPGWVCYAEKTHFKGLPGSENRVQAGTDEEGSHLIQHLSKIRSPQQLLAGLLKQLTSSVSCSKSPFLVFVMPCYDKKLEASRNEFTLPDGVEKEADLVLGTNEFISVLELLLQEPSLPTVETSSETASHCQRVLCMLSSRLTPDAPLPDRMYRHAGSGSGGYAFHTLRFAADKLFQITLPVSVTDDPRVLTRKLGNQDMQEILLFSSAEDCTAAKAGLSGRTPYRHAATNPAPLLAFLVANGFRNIQTVVQQLKRAYTKANLSRSSVRAEVPFDYIEIMACPNGCLNGGAQAKVDLAYVTQAYFSLEERDVLTSDPARCLLKLTDSDSKIHTTYRVVPKIEITSPSSLKW
ncbi:unnamed protein product, partial [Mesocestoides corti]